MSLVWNGFSADFTSKTRVPNTLRHDQSHQEDQIWSLHQIEDVIWEPDVLVQGCLNCVSAKVQGRLGQKEKQVACFEGLNLTRDITPG